MQDIIANIYGDDELSTLVHNGLINTPESLAKIIYYYNENNFMFAEDDEWYYYKNNRWYNSGKKCSALRSLIEPILGKIYKDMHSLYKNNGDMDMVLKIKKIITSIEKKSYKKNIITELANIYSTKNNPEQDFTLKLNANQNLIGFDNGVYDLSTFTFRDGSYDDYISLTTGYDYLPTYTEQFNELQQYLKDILPVKADLEYFLTYLSLGLCGCNISGLNTILYGNGRNGISKLLDLINKTFGNYHIPTSPQVLTSPINLSQPNPHLIWLAQKKIVTINNIDRKQKVDTDFIKFITGKETLELRNCYSKKTVKLSPTFLTFLVCSQPFERGANNIFEDCNLDQGIRTKTQCIFFPTEFVDNPTKAHQKELDPQINENFVNWRSDFMLLLLSYYKKYTEGIILLQPSAYMLQFADMCDSRFN